MDESTHTGATTETGDQSGHSQTPEVQTQVSDAVASNTQVESTPTNTGTADATTEVKTDEVATNFDQDLADWAAKTGRPTPTTEAEKKLLQEIRNNQRGFHANRQPKTLADETTKAVSGIAPLLGDDNDGELDPSELRINKLEQEVQQEKFNRVLTEFFVGQNVTAEVSDSMQTFLKEKVEQGGKQAYDYWTNPANLQDWHDLARARVQAVTGSSHVAEQAKAQERERLAQLQQAQTLSAGASMAPAPKADGYDRDAFFKSGYNK